MHPRLANLLAKHPDLEPAIPAVEDAIAALAGCYREGGMVLVCGNGGSAADAEHLVGELMKGYLAQRPVADEVRQALLAQGEAGAYVASKLQGALPTLSLASQMGLITAISNDIAGDMIFAQQVVGYGAPGDILIAISTSGRSANVLNAVRVARAIGMRSIAFTGGAGGALRGLCDVAVCVPAHDTASIQERHLAIYHVVCAMLEEALFPGNAPSAQP